MRGRRVAAVALVGALLAPVAVAAQDGGITIWSWSLAKERGFGAAIDALPSPLKAFGGAAPIEGKSIIAIDIAGAPSQAGFEAAMLHGMGSLTAGQEKAAGKPACEGSGETPKQALRLTDETSDAPEAVLHCARRLHPGAIWQSALIAGDGARYYSVIQLRNPSGDVSVVYADLTDWAEDRGL